MKIILNNTIKCDHIVWRGSWRSWSSIYEWDVRNTRKRIINTGPKFKFLDGRILVTMICNYQVEDDN